MAERKIRKLKIGDLLNAVDRRDGTWLARQPEDARREFAPIVALRFLSATTGGDDLAAYMLQALNTTMNVHLWDLYEHPDLVFRLAASCGVGEKVTRGGYFAGTKPKPPANAARDFLAAQHPSYAPAELDLVIAQLTPESFFELVRHLPVGEAKTLTAAFAKLIA